MQRNSCPVNGGSNRIIADQPGQDHVIPALAKKTVFVFDWDGTLFDSMTAKTQSFAGVMEEWLAARQAPLPHDEIARLYRFHSGIPRREIFRRIARQAGTEATDADCEAMSGALFARNRTALEGAPLFDDALPCLEALLHAGRSVSLSSSVPQDELSHFVSRKLPEAIRSRLVVVLGSQPDLAKGVGHLGAIRTATRADSADILVIGDDMADRELSGEAGVDSLLVDRDGHLPPQTPCISSLNQITGLL